MVAVAASCSFELRQSQKSHECSFQPRNTARHLRPQSDGTGLRISELLALKWRDVDFRAREISITRSIVFQVVGPCKTEASQKPIPLDSYLAKTLRAWRKHTKYRRPDDWVFASPASCGRRPYWAQSIMRNLIRPAAVELGITERIGWHTFRHTYDRSGHQGNARTASARLQSSHIGHVYTGSHASQTQSSK